LLNNLQLIVPGYSLIKDHRVSLPVETLEAITTSFAITGASNYAVALSSLHSENHGLPLLWNWKWSWKCHWRGSHQDL